MQVLRFEAGSNVPGSQPSSGQKASLLASPNCWAKQGAQVTVHCWNTTTCPPLLAPAALNIPGALAALIIPGAPAPGLLSFRKHQSCRKDKITTIPPDISFHMQRGLFISCSAVLAKCYLSGNHSRASSENCTAQSYLGFLNEKSKRSPPYPATMASTKSKPCLSPFNNHCRLIPAWPNKRGRRKMKSVSLHAPTGRAVAPAPSHLCW
ncbi:uncharacterized protein LOC109363868 [Meleagris gallopavo]|uniref:uncharacterized protein LOC109363868 n=1 Tax=Meleagris gallopavo TaxID=9103 RepID=UPI0009396361|nr:uncharacterized protein LOC109363868 [Meleagris gallopavo]